MKARLIVEITVGNPDEATGRGFTLPAGTEIVIEGNLDAETLDAVYAPDDLAIRQDFWVRPSEIEYLVS